MNATGDHGSEVQGDVTPGTRWMTYRELADFLGVEEESGRRRAQRGRWPRRPGNDGKARVGVPGDIAPDGTRKAARDDGGGDAGDVTPALVALTERQAAELAKQRERAARAEGEAAALRDALVREVARADRADAARQAAEDERDNLATEIIQERERRAQAKGELTGLRVAFDQLQSRAQRVEGERNAAAEASWLAQQAAQEAAAEAAAARSATTRAAALAAEEHAARRAAETAAEAARSELADWTAGGPLGRAWRALLFKRGRP
jgi:DNA repair exonuclease SbcCD ATPase subunit